MMSPFKISFIHKILKNFTFWLYEEIFLKFSILFLKYTIIRLENKEKKIMIRPISLPFCVILQASINATSMLVPHEAQLLNISFFRVGFNSYNQYY